MRASEMTEIRHLSLFRDMMQANFESLMVRAYSQAFPAGVELIRQGDPADFLHVVLEGAVELFASWGEKQSTMAMVRPLGTFILAACIKDVPYLMSARTVERTRVLMIPVSDLRGVFRRDTEFAVSVVTELAGAYRIMVRHAKDLKLRNARERIAAYLLRQSAAAGHAASFLLPIEKRFLASYLGMTPENLSRTLKLLEANGVKIDGARVIITDRAALAGVARLDRLLDGDDGAAVQ